MEAIFSKFLSLLPTKQPPEPFGTARLGSDSPRLGLGRALVWDSPEKGVLGRLGLLLGRWVSSWEAPPPAFLLWGTRWARGSGFPSP